MIYTRDAVFIHVPKTGGMSVTRFLVNALDCPVTVVAPANAEAHSMGLAASPSAAAKLNHVRGDRHETCEQAVSLIRAHSWPMPPAAFAMIRHPADLMLSYYRHMRKPVVWKLRGMSAETLGGIPKLAMDLPFDAFCQATAFYGMQDDDLMAYYTSSGLAALDIVPLPEIRAYLYWRFGRNRNFGQSALEHKNRSIEPVPEDAVSAETDAYITSMYPRVSQLYCSTLGAGAWCSGASVQA
ncbi:hypothetical protein ACEWPM_018405 [Roseovarius sp. S4756]|uniref:hypothetical protein n=1 Tax=Roseovarius maritimus TaxID=3342637 RepID=UPI00372C399F